MTGGRRWGGGRGGGGVDAGVLVDPEELEGLTDQEKQQLLEVPAPPRCPMPAVPPRTAADGTCAALTAFQLMCRDARLMLQVQNVVQAGGRQVQNECCEVGGQNRETMMCGIAALHRHRWPARTFS